MAQAYTQALQNIVIPSLLSGQALSAAKDLSLAPGGIKLAPPTTRVIPIQAVHTSNARRRVHPALIALVAVFFLMVMPFALGLSLSPNNVSLQASTIRGANAQFVAKLLPPAQVTKTTPVPNSSNQPDQPRGNGHGSGGHGHKHKHGHADGG
jgi:hypothetical protein